jgi:hypothetical protein
MLQASLYVLTARQQAANPQGVVKLLLQAAPPPAGAGDRVVAASTIIHSTSHSTGSHLFGGARQLEVQQSLLCRAIGTLRVEVAG